jgi:hypothetical protein
MANISQVGVSSGKFGHFGAHQKRIQIQYVSRSGRQQRRLNEDGHRTSRYGLWFCCGFSPSVSVAKGESN